MHRPAAPMGNPLDPKALRDRYRNHSAHPILNPKPCDGDSALGLQATSFNGLGIWTAGFTIDRGCKVWGLDGVGAIVIYVYI